MLKVTFFRDKDKNCVGFDAKGHAGFGEEGADIVCASASMLIINTMNAIEQLTDTKATIDADEAKGDISYRFLDMPSKEANLLIEAMMMGLHSLEEDETYAKYVDIIYEGGVDNDET
jgi:uncharacterized protein YsxB (DUF464 family)